MLDEVKEDKLKVFSEAFLALLNVSNNYLSTVLESQVDSLETIILLLEKIRRNKRRVHLIGMGRSRLAAKVIGEALKLKGINVSIVGDTLSKPVNKDDTIIAVSASGWTNTTCYVVEEGIRLGAKIIAFTATHGSKLDRLADITIYLPGKSRIDGSYILRRMQDRRKTPLAPMGTIPEINAFLVGASIALSINEEDPINTFKRIAELMIENAFRSYHSLMNKSKEDLISVITSLSEAIKDTKIKVFFSGSGISEIVGLMSAMRFQHLGINVLSLEDWKFREKDDILIVISSSGESAVPLLYSKEAKRTNLRLYHITSRESSSIAKLADNKIILQDIVPNRIEYLEYRVSEEGRVNFIPAFEFSALLTMESLVAQLADIQGILETDMRLRHANIE